MTTETMPTVGQFFILKIAKALSRDKARETSNRAQPWFHTVIRLVFHLAGFTSLTYAGFYWHPIAGFVTMGLSFFLMSTLITARPMQQPGTPPNHSWATGDRRG